MKVPCTLPLEYPDLWPRMLKLLRSLVDAATPFMQHQARAGHFEFLGLDVIADEAGGVWLIEGGTLTGFFCTAPRLEGSRDSPSEG